MSILFEPFNLGDIKLANRIVMAPMTRARAQDGVADEQTALYYQQRAGAGLIVTEGAPVSEEARGYLFTPGLYTPEQAAGWKKVTDAVHAADGKIYAQLWHVGRLSHTSLQPSGGAPVSSTAARAQTSNAFAYDENGNPGNVPASTPRALTPQEIRRVTGDFVKAARTAMDAGFDGVEIHGANGYIFEQFINGALNDRTDEYGGSIENRLRFLLETVDAVSKEIGNRCVGVRISPFGRLFDMEAFDDEAQTWLRAASELDARDLSYVHLSDQLSMGLPGIPPTFSADFCAHFNGTLIAAGGFDRQKGEKALAEGRLSLIAIGKPFIANPDLVERLRNSWPLTSPDPATFYGLGEKGYTDYPMHDPR